MRMKGSYPRLSVASTVALLLLSISKGSQAHHCQRLDFGSCASPSIKYGWDIDGSQRYGYLPANENDFPHGWSPDIATIESFICNRLESPCNAPPDTVERCRDSFNLYSGLSGDDAINAWNSALGSAERDEHDDDDDDTHHCSSADSDQSYYLTTTMTTLVDVEMSTTETTFTHTRTEVDTTKTHEIPSPSSTLTTTLTLPSSPTTTDHPPIPSTWTSTETQTTVQTTPTDTPTSSSSSSTTAASTESSTSSPNSNSNDGDSGPAGGGGSPFSPESAAPTLAVLGNEGPLKLVFLLSLLALLIALWYR